MKWQEQRIKRYRVDGFMFCFSVLSAKKMEKVDERRKKLLIEGIMVRHGGCAPLKTTLTARTDGDKVCRR